MEINLIFCGVGVKSAFNSWKRKTMQIKPFDSTYVIFGADNRTCSERSERNSASKAILLPSGASAACRGTQSVQTMPCIVTSPVANQDMKKRTEQFRFVFVCFGADNRT